MPRVAVLDVDRTLIDDDGNYNDALIDMLLEQGITDVVLNTSYEVKNVGLEHSVDRTPIVEYLKLKGLNVKAVVVGNSALLDKEHGVDEKGSSFGRYYTEVIEPVERAKSANTEQLVEEATASEVTYEKSVVPVFQKHKLDVKSEARNYEKLDMLDYIATELAELYPGEDLELLVFDDRQGILSSAQRMQTSNLYPRTTFAPFLVRMASDNEAFYRVQLDDHQEWIAWNAEQPAGAQKGFQEWQEYKKTDTKFPTWHAQYLEDRDKRAEIEADFLEAFIEIMSDPEKIDEAVEKRATIQKLDDNQGVKLSAYEEKEVTDVTVDLVRTKEFFSAVLPATLNPADRERIIVDAVISVIIDGVLLPKHYNPIMGKITVDPATADAIQEEMRRVKAQIEDAARQTLRDAFRDSKETGFAKSGMTPNPELMRRAKSELARQKLIQYIREREAERKKSGKYKTFKGRLAGLSATVKITAARKMLRHLSGGLVFLTDKEKRALQQGELGNLMSEHSLETFPSFGEILKSDPAKAFDLYILMRYEEKKSEKPSRRSMVHTKEGPKFGTEAAVKIEAAKKMKKAFGGDNKVEFSTAEIVALRQGRLGKITAQLAKQGKLPQAFTDAKLSAKNGKKFSIKQRIAMKF